MMPNPGKPGFGWGEVDARSTGRVGKAKRAHHRVGTALRAFAHPTLLIAVFVAHPALAQKRAPEPPARIEIAAAPIDVFDPRAPSQVRFGALEFRGGMALTSSHRDFGGLSAIRVAADGAQFVALSDKAHWLTGRIVYDGARRPRGIAAAVLAPMLGPDGRTLAARGWYDTESLAQDGGTLYVGIERVNRVVRFDFGRLGVLARAEPVPAPAGVARLPHNKGLEALEIVPKGQPLAGALIAISERGLDPQGNIRAFLIGGPTPGEFSIKRSEDFDVTDCALLPSGDLLVLERRFFLWSGVAMRIRRVPQSAIAPGALVDGATLIFADMAYQIDNMEGLSVYRNQQGEIILTLVSDDNFSALQRTLLLQFRLVEE
jgi:hypothetical protein